LQSYAWLGLKIRPPPSPPNFLFSRRRRKKFGYVLISQPTAQKKFGSGLYEPRDPDHAPFRDNLTSAGWDLLPLHLETKFDGSNYTRYEDMRSGTKSTN